MLSARPAVYTIWGDVMVARASQNLKAGDEAPHCCAVPSLLSQASQASQAARSLSDLWTFGFPWTCAKRSSPTPLVATASGAGQETPSTAGLWLLRLLQVPTLRGGSHVALKGGPELCSAAEAHLCGHASPSKAVASADLQLRHVQQIRQAVTVVRSPHSPRERFEKQRSRVEGILRSLDLKLEEKRQAVDGCL